MRTILSLFLLAVCLPCFAQQKHYTIYFNLDKDSLTPAAVKLLSEISALPGNVNIKQINLAGYADKYGTANYNKALSKKRVQAVAQAFNSVLPGSTVINTAYYGKDSLITAKDEEQQLNRRVEITLTYTEPAAHDLPGTKEAPVTKLEPYSEDAALQEFTINLDDTTTVRGDDGTWLKIPPGTIKTAEGKTAKGMATLLMKEYYSPGTIVLAGLTTRSGNELLQTGGMVWFRVVQNGDTMSTETKKAIEIRMPVTNSELKNMGVFAMHNRLDSAGWNNINRSFKVIDGYWDWPKGSEKTSGATNYGYSPFYRYENWIIGGKEEDEYRVTIPALFFWPGIRLMNVSRIKKVKRLITKIDSTTLSVQAHITYRARGVRAFGTKYYDTTFNVKYMKAAYTANVSRLNWLNCDRFLYAKNKTNLHIKTANCEGAGIMLYFKKLQAYMPAYSYRNVYEVNNIPEDEDVSIIAFGKQGDGFYFTNKEYKVGKNSTVTVNLEKVTKEEFKRKIMKLG